MNSDFEKLKHCADADDLKTLLHSICSRFGEVMRLEILVSSRVGKRQALCFLRLATLEQEQNFMRELQAGRFAGDVVLIVDLLEKSVGPSRNLALDPLHDVEKPFPRKDFQPTLPMALFSVSPIAPSTSPSSRTMTEPFHFSNQVRRDVWCD